MMIHVPRAELVAIAPPNITNSANPYLTYQATLRKAFYPEPSPGFSARLWILFAITLIGVLLVLVRYVLLGIDNTRRKTRTWWWRTVKQSSGTFLVLGHDAITQAATLLTSVVFLVEVVMQHEYFLDDYDLTGSAAWRTFGWIPLIMQGWLLAWCSLFSRLVVSESKGRPWPKWVAPGSQIIFWVLTIALLTPLVALSTLSVLRWKGVWEDYKDFEVLLEASIPTWTGVSDDRMRAVMKQLRSLTAAATRHYDSDLAIKSVMAIFLLFTQFVNVAGLQIYGTIRRQITQNIEAFGNPNPSFTNQSSMFYHSHYNNDKMAPTAANIKLASQDDKSRFAEQAKRIRDLQRASNNTLIRTAGVLTSGIILLAVFCWKITIPSLNFNSTKMPFSTIELATFLPIWIYQLSVIPITISYIYTIITHMPSKGTSTPKKPPPVDTLDAFFFEIGGDGDIIPLDLPMSPDVTVHLPPTPLQVHLNLLSEK